MKNIEDFISPFVENQFPSFYKEEGENFLAFVKAYYEWLETTGQVTQQSRDLLEYRDIDLTIDDFLVYFKKKYLQSLPFTTTANKKFLIKHVQDLYRTKGTERGVELLLRLLYNINSVVYYPGEDVFKLSDGEWDESEYIEVSPALRNNALVGKVVLGTTSSATAFVERIVRKRVFGKFIDVLFISARTGDFLYQERIVEKANPIIEGSPKVIGSLSSLTVVNGGQDYTIGDVLDITTGNGQLGKAIVTEVSQKTGRVRFAILDGGYGYSTSAQVIVSQRNLTVSDITNANSEITGFQLFETIQQPLATIEYTTSNTAAFSNGNIIENYDGGGATIASALIVGNEPTNNTAGTMTVVPITGNVATDSTISISGNSATATITAFNDITATANLMYVNSTSLGVFNKVNEFTAAQGNYIVGLTSNTYANVTIRSTGVGATFSIGGLTNSETVLIFPDLLRANNTGNVAFMDILLDGSNSNVASNGYGFVKYPAGDINTTLQNILRQQTKTIGEISVLRGINPGEGYNADPYVLIIEPEIVAFGKRDFTLTISGTTGLFVTGEAIESTSNNPGQLLTISSFSGTAANGDPTSAPEVGEYVWQNDGASNTASGFIYETNVVGGAGTIKLNNTTGTFTNTYGINTLTTNATATVNTASNTALVVQLRGTVKSANSTTVKVKRINLYNDFNVGDSVVGKLSGTVATITDVAEDFSLFPIGENADVEANVQIANTVVSSLRVIDSGFGYIDNETVILSTTTNPQIVTARTTLTNQGRGEGVYKSEKGFIDAASKIHDGDYYQEYSYEVQTSVPLNKYASILKDVAHIAGTKFFGQVTFDSTPEINQQGFLIESLSRSYSLNVVDGEGQYTLGEVVSQGNTNGTYSGFTGTIVIANNNPYILIDTQISTPSFSGNTSSAIVRDITSNATHSTLFIDQQEGTIDTGDSFEAVMGKTININNVQQGNTVTGSFAIGETVYQSNTLGGVQTANGVVFTANSTQIKVRGVNMEWTSNATIYGVTSNAYANVFSVVNTSNTYTSITSINTLHISNTVGKFLSGQLATGANSGATANIIYASLNIDT